MIDLDVSALRQIPQLISGVLRLDTETFSVLHGLPRASLLGWVIVLAVGVSEALGQSIMLFVNKVKPAQFVKALLAVGFSYSLSLILWLLSTWAIANLLFDAGLSWRTLARTLAFACTPLIFSFLAAMPYFGVAALFAIGFWSLLAMTTGLEAITDLWTQQALFSVVLGYLVFQLLRRTIGRPVVAFTKQLETRATGVELKRDIRDLYALTREEVKQLKPKLEGHSHDL